MAIEVGVVGRIVKKLKDMVQFQTFTREKFEKLDENNRDTMKLIHNMHLDIVKYKAEINEKLNILINQSKK